VKNELEKKDFYIDNIEFSIESEKYSQRCKKAKAKYIEKHGDVTNKEWQSIRPDTTDYIAECYILIANKLSKSKNFKDYSNLWKDEMIADAILDCIKYGDRYDENKGPTKYSAFPYFTQICWFAFIGRIKKEKKNTDLYKKVTQDERDSRNFASFQPHDQNDQRFINDSWDFSTPTNSED
jgi:hypothetical protein